MSIAISVGWPIAILLLSLRIAVVFAFAPPFTLIAAPIHIRVLLAIAIATCLASTAHMPASLGRISNGTLVAAAVTELAIGTAFAFALQASFASLYFAGRVLDVQTGFGLALLIDPTTANQVPLLGTVFVYAAGMLFFLGNGHLQLMRLLILSTQTIPVGSTVFNMHMSKAIAFMAGIFALGLAAAAAAMVVLFLIDLSIAFISRTLPQMNVLLFGLQVKTLALLIVLAATFGLIGPLLLRVLVSGLQFAAQVA